MRKNISNLIMIAIYLGPLALGGLGILWGIFHGSMAWLFGSAIATMAYYGYLYNNTYKH